jgi:N-acetylglucosaminyldiphosphoundecaprenol N-acetyl-beta-D-mannosaminyltransferase
MLLRAVLGYAPSNLVPALVALATIVIFTRVLPPDEFGRYAVAQAVVLLVQALAFYGLQVATTRFYAARREAGSLPGLLATAYGCFAVLVVLAVAGSALAIALLAPEPRLAAVLWAALPLLALRGLVSINLAIHRSALAIGRHNLIECSQSLVGLVLAVLLVTVLGQGAVGIVLGLAGGSLLAAALDLGLPARHLRRPDPAILREVARFAAPLVLSYALGAVIAYGDRLFLERLAGADAVAIYAVAFGIVDRPVTLLFMAVTLAAFPLAVDRLEREGPAAARAQLQRNGALLLALAVPAAVGLACIAEPLATVVVGPDYRAGVAAILPWIAALALIQGLTAHYFGHAFHLANRTDLFVRLLAPAAVASLVLNPLLIPVWGLAGSLAAAFAAQGTALVLTAATARRVFPIGFPVAQALRVALAAAVMALAIEAAALPPTLLGLVLAILLGAGIYGAAVLLLDVAGIGTAILGRLRAAGSRPEPAAAVRIFGIEVVNETVEAALARLAAVMATPGPTSLFFVNTHTLNVAIEDPAYRRLLAGADLVFGDGTGVRWAARCRGVRMQANLNGTDLVPALLARGRGLRCYLLGHTPDGIARAAEHVRRTWPNCTLVGFHHGYLDEDSTREVIAAINAGDVDLLLVGMGNPLQERWIARHRPQLAARLCVGVGGLFSYWAQDLDRAPAWMRRHGVEWLHILRRQPWKSRRFLLGNPLFVWRMLRWLPADLQGTERPAGIIPAGAAALASVPSSAPPGRRPGVIGS